MDYALHFHIFGEPAMTDECSKNQKEPNSGWLLEALDFRALPGRGVQCFINGKRILVSPLSPGNKKGITTLWSIPLRSMLFAHFDVVMNLTGW